MITHPTTGPPSLYIKLIVGVARAALRDHRALGHAVAVATAMPISSLTSKNISGGLGAPPPDSMRSVGMIFSPGLLALLVEERDVERGRPAGHGHAVAPEDLDRLRRHERLEQHGGHAVRSSIITM